MPACISPVTALVLACILASVLANAPHAAAPAARGLQWSSTVAVDTPASFAVLGSDCLVSGLLSTASAGTITVSLVAAAGTPPRAWPSTLAVGVFPTEQWETLALANNISCTTLSATVFSSYASASAASGAQFLAVSVTNAAILQKWTTVAFACPSAPLPAMTATLAYNQSAAAAAATPLTCPAPAAEAGAHGSGSSKIQVAIVAAFGGVVWLAVVFFVVKNTCSQQFFAFANAMTTVPPGQNGAAPAVLSTHEEGDVESGGALEAPASSRGTRKIRFDPKRKQHATIKQSLAAVATITSFKAMPPRFAAALGSFTVLVVTAIWASLLLASAEVENWPSFIGAGITVIIIVMVVMWCYMRAQMGAQTSNEAVDQLQREFAYAVERSKEEMAEELQMEEATH